MSHGQVTRIVFLTRHATPGVAPPELADVELERLAADLARHRSGASVLREPPAIWVWEPLLEAGVIDPSSCAGVAEIDLSDETASRSVLKRVLAEWQMGLASRDSLQVVLVWASHFISFKTERLEPGAPFPEATHDDQDEDGERCEEARRPQRQGGALCAHRR
jgi:hypothetical protein